jgi:hypothetical protein
MDFLIMSLLLNYWKIVLLYRRSDNVSQQPGINTLCVQASAITMYNTELVKKLRKQVAVNDNFICYALKTGQLRILGRKQAGQKALIKGLQAPVSDMQ